MIQVKTDGTLWAWGSYDPRIEAKKRLYRIGMRETLMFLSPDYGVFLSPDYGVKYYI